MSLKAFVFGNYTVKGDSMNDTLSDGDVVWAAKLASPDYGDIILVMDDDTNLVKRAVGFAGDRLWMERDDSETGSKWYLCRKRATPTKSSALQRKGTATRLCRVSIWK